MNKYMFKVLIIFSITFINASEFYGAGSFKNIGSSSRVIALGNTMFSGIVSSENISEYLSIGKIETDIDKIPDEDEDVENIHEVGKLLRRNGVKIVLGDYQKVLDGCKLSKNDFCNLGKPFLLISTYHFPDFNFLIYITTFPFSGRTRDVQTC